MCEEDWPTEIIVLNLVDMDLRIDTEVVNFQD
jgi:hypothetical protein